MKYAFAATATAAALFLSVVALSAPRWISCADGDRDYCAEETFTTLGACDRFNAATPYGEDAQCLVAQ